MSLQIKKFKNLDASSGYTNTLDYWIYDLEISSKNPVSTILEISDKYDDDYVISLYKKDLKGKSKTLKTKSDTTLKTKSDTTLKTNIETPKESKPLKKIVKKVAEPIVTKPLKKIIVKKPLEVAKTTVKDMENTFAEFFGK